MADSLFSFGWCAWAGLAVLLGAIGPAAAEQLYTGSLPPARIIGSEPPAAPDLSGRGRLLVLGFAGDLGFAGSEDSPSAEGAVKHGSVIPWDRLASGVSPLLKADANFANLETVVADGVPLTPVEKQFNFLSRPEGLRRAVGMGITVLTAANNHAGDFGAEGILATLSQLAAARAEGLRAHAGLGIGAERYRPASFTLGNTSVAVGAIGLGINHAGADGPGQPLYASPQDFDRVVTALADTDADVRVLSAHYGRELVSLPGDRDEARFRRTIDDGAAQIVFGHHSHVPSAVEMRKGGIIFYGLGNFMHAGTQDMSRYGACRDFGLYAKVYVWVMPGAEPRIRAVELFPLRGMHAVPIPFEAREATRRIAIVNAMNAAVTGGEDPPLRFEATGGNSGLACLGDQQVYGDELAARCRAAAGPLQSLPLTSRASLASCGTAPPAQPAPAPAATVVAEQAPPPAVKPVKPRPSKAAAADRTRQKNLLQKLFD